MKTVWERIAFYDRCKCIDCQMEIAEIKKEYEPKEKIMTEWIDWEKQPAPKEIKGFFIKYESGFIDCDRYDFETKERKYRNEKIVSWKLMKRSDRKSVKAISHLDKYDPNQTCNFCNNPESILTEDTCCTGCSKLSR